MIPLLKIQIELLEEKDLFEKYHGVKFIREGYYIWFLLTLAVAKL